MSSITTIFEAVSIARNMDNKNRFQHIVRMNDIVYKMQVYYDSIYMFQSSCAVSMFVFGRGFLPLLTLSGDEMPKPEKGVSVEDYLRAQALTLFETATSIVQG
jgi:hypothetical protein